VIGSEEVPMAELSVHDLLFRQIDALVRETADVMHEASNKSEDVLAIQANIYRYLAARFAAQQRMAEAFTKATPEMKDGGDDQR
jgi:hypothetical protein